MLVVVHPLAEKPLAAEEAVIPDPLDRDDAVIPAAEEAAGKVVSLPAAPVKFQSDNVSACRFAATAIAAANWLNRCIFMGRGLISNWVGSTERSNFAEDAKFP